MLPGHASPSNSRRALEERDRSGVTPDGRGTEDMVAEAVIEMRVRIDDDRDRVARQLAEVVLDLACLRVRRSGVDHHGGALAKDDTDVLVEERVAPDEHAVADLGPCGHAGIVGRSGVGSVRFPWCGNKTVSGHGDRIVLGLGCIVMRSARSVSEAGCMFMRGRLRSSPSACHNSRGAGI
jgi:hypothetical protein